MLLNHCPKDIGSQNPYYNIAEKCWWPSEKDDSLDIYKLQEWYKMISLSWST